MDGPRHLEHTYYEVQKQSSQNCGCQFNAKATIQDEQFQKLLSDIDITYLQKSRLLYEECDMDLVMALEQLRANLKPKFKEKGLHGEVKPIGSLVSQLKTSCLDEIDTAFLIDKDEGYECRATPGSRVYDVHKSERGDSYPREVGARALRESFAKDVQDIMAAVDLPSGLQHSGYASPKFSGVRYNGPATTMLLTWDPEGEKREISMDVTPMLHLPLQDESDWKSNIARQIKQINKEMPHVIFPFDGIYLFPNPITDQWELTTACYEATSLLDHIPLETPFKTSIVMCKIIGSRIAKLPVPSSITELAPSKEMENVATILSNPVDHTQESMKYGHAFLTPESGKVHREMAKRAISINNAAITHTILSLTNNMPGAFTSTHEQKKHKAITRKLMIHVFEQLSSSNTAAQHFFLDTTISFHSIATWARQSYDARLLVENLRMQCLMVACILTHGIIGFGVEDEILSLEQYKVLPAQLRYAEESFRVAAKFNGERCNESFAVLLKLINALGNTFGGIIHVYDNESVLECEPGNMDQRKHGETNQTSNILMWQEAFKTLCEYHNVLPHVTFLNVRHYAVDLHVRRFPANLPLVFYSIAETDEATPKSVTRETHRYYSITNDGTIRHDTPLTVSNTHVNQDQSTQINNRVTGQLTSRNVSDIELEVDIKDEVDNPNDEKVDPDDEIDNPDDGADDPDDEADVRSDEAGDPDDEAGDSDEEVYVDDRDGSRDDQDEDRDGESHVDDYNDQSDSTTSKEIHNVPTDQPGNRTEATPPSVLPKSADWVRLRKERYQVGWTTHSRKWDKNLHQVNIDIESSVRDMVNRETTILKPTRPMTFIPSKEAILHRYPALSVALQKIEQLIGVDEAIAIACNSWRKRADIAVSEVLEAPNHVLDIFAFTRSCMMHIFCLIQEEEGEDVSEAWTYVLTLGQATKRAVCSGQSCDVHVQCHVYSCTTQKMISSDVIGENTGSITDLMYEVAHLLIRQTSCHKDRLGHDLSITLTAQQLEAILISICHKFVLVEGPPGCGKTYMAFHVCAQYEQHQVLYMCSTVAFKEFLNTQIVCTSELVRDENDMKELSSRVNLANYKCLIIDDGHQLCFSYKTWKAFFDMAKKYSYRVYIFIDSKYQNFKEVDLQPLKRCLDEEEDSAIQIPLYVIHRNSKKVTSYIVSTAEDDTNGDQLACSSQIDGQDVEVLYLNNVFERSESNKLLHLINSLLRGPSIDRHVYDSKDIAILIDTREAEKDAEQLMSIIQHFMSGLSVHSAGTFPVTGITVDTLDNFMGFDRPICLCISREWKMDIGTKLKTLLLKKLPERHLLNPKYKTFVASRGVSSVRFIIDQPVSAEVATTMQMDSIQTKPRHLWTKNIMIRDMSWLSTAGTSALLYTTGSSIRLLSSNEEHLPLEMDISNIENPELLASTQDGELIVVADPKNHSWTVFRRQTGFVYRQKASYSVNGEPRAIRWTPDNDVIMLVLQDGQEKRLRRYRVTDGHLLWEHTFHSLVDVWLAVAPEDGHILLGYSFMIYIYSASGKQIRITTLSRLFSLSYPDDSTPISVNPMSNDTWVTANKFFGNKIWKWDPGNASLLIDTGDEVVRDTALSRDRLLAVHTFGHHPRSVHKLSVYDVEGALQ